MRLKILCCNLSTITELKFIIFETRQQDCLDFNVLSIVDPINDKRQLQYIIIACLLTKSIKWDRSTPRINSSTAANPDSINVSRAGDKESQAVWGDAAVCFHCNGNDTQWLWETYPGNMWLSNHSLTPGGVTRIKNWELKSMHLFKFQNIIVWNVSAYNQGQKDPPVSLAFPYTWWRCNIINVQYFYCLLWYADSSSLGAITAVLVNFNRMSTIVCFGPYFF